MPIPIPQFGQVVTETSYVDGKPTTKKSFVKKNVRVTSYIDTMTELGDLIKEAAENSQNKKVDLEITISPLTNEPSLIQSRYLVNREKT